MQNIASFNERIHSIFMDQLRELEKFSGKRNTAMTFIIPPHTEFHKNLNGIMRTIMAIKHTNKRGQSKRVLNHVMNETHENTKFDNNGVIVCAGLDNSNSIFYRFIKSPSLIMSFEYYYDYVFNVNRIKEIFFENNVVSLDSAKESYHRNTLLKKLSDDDPRITLGDEVGESLSMNMLEYVYYFSNESIPYDILEKIVTNNITMYRFDMDNVHNKDISKKYGKMIGILRYAIGV